MPKLRPQPQSPVRWSRQAMIAVFAAGVVVLAPARPAGASKAGDDLKAKQAQQAAVRQQRAEVAAKLDVLKANAEQMHNALATLDEDVQAQAATTTTAAQAADQALRASALADQHL